MMQENFSSTTYRATMRDVFPESVALDGLKNDKNKVYHVSRKEQKIVRDGASTTMVGSNLIGYGNFFYSDVTRHVLRTIAIDYRFIVSHYSDDPHCVAHNACSVWCV
jgi:hypothetical protein